MNLAMELLKNKTEVKSTEEFGEKTRIEEIKKLGDIPVEKLRDDLSSDEIISHSNKWLMARKMVSFKCKKGDEINIFREVVKYFKIMPPVARQSFDIISIIMRPIHGRKNSFILIPIPLTEDLRDQIIRKNIKRKPYIPSYAASKSKFGKMEKVSIYHFFKDWITFLYDIKFNLLMKLGQWVVESMGIGIFYGFEKRHGWHRLKGLQKIMKDFSFLYD